uniref:16S rRNA (cytosine(967)-C(5))-methyltransferase n=1 Tax=Thermodesulfovibrio aggregans TaxID=86166 RepID=A0A7C4EMA9_9BACT
MVHKSQNPRQKAVEILSGVLGRNKPLKMLLTDDVLSRFDKSDRGFLLEIVYGVLRNLYFIDWLLEGFYKNKKKLSVYTINNLRCAVYQLIFMRVPEYAAVFEAVNIEKIYGEKTSAVNAILRNFLRKYKKEGVPQAEHLSIKYSHPEWLISRWLKRFPENEIEAFLKANNEKPPFTIAVKPEERNKVTFYLNSKGFKTNLTKYSPSGLIVEGQGYEIRKTLMESSFFWIVQDEASQLACFLLQPFNGLTVLDACASPGGKTLLTAVLMKKGRIICLEKNRVRMKILKENIERLKKFLPDIEIETILADARHCENVLQKNLKFERIIVDAPCSSLGVIRRNPDVRYRVSEREIERLSKTQRLILEKVSSFLSPNGILVYSVCSTEPEEGEQVINNFLQKHDEFCSIKMLRTYPHIHGMDGFYIAKLLKTE